MKLSILKQVFSTGLLVAGYLSWQQGVLASAPPVSAEQRQQQQLLSEVVDMARDAIMASKDFSDQTLLSCLRAFGHKQFCDCLSRELPGSQSFDSYIFFITTEKEDLNYANLKADDRELVDNAAQARSTCVHELGGG